ncbi:MAG: fumarylacetoacetate hydrolase family protein [Planctomycetes bacterium]|nr:fumarylacetoacetate hydrolase family protein [Planctomycetota bacterium]
MRILTFKHDERVSTGCLLSNDQILDFTHPDTELPQPSHELGWFDLNGESLGGARILAEKLGDDGDRCSKLIQTGAILFLKQVKILAPIQRPGKFLCIGLNYRDHAEESNMEVPEEPVVFSKCITAITGPDTPVFLPESSQRVDYEAEFAIVIGKRCHRVPREEASQYVLGYTCVNDVSARDLQERDGQWVRAKSLDSFGPMGETIVTSDEINDPHKLGIRLRLNGETLQNSNTDQLIFGVEELVSFLSRDITLEPGDVISTGTPPGVGFARNPPIYLKDGDVMEVEIDGIGVLRNSVRR